MYKKRIFTPTLSRRMRVVRLGRFFIVIEFWFHMSSPRNTWCPNSRCFSEGRST